MDFHEVNSSCIDHLRLQGCAARGRRKRLSYSFLQRQPNGDCAIYVTPPHQIQQVARTAVPDQPSFSM